MDDAARLEARNALASQMFPKEWAKAQAPGKSKKRQQLRQGAERELVRRQRQAEGHSCADCSARFKTSEGKHACGFESDFHGDMIVKLTDLCWRWYTKESDNG